MRALQCHARNKVKEGLLKSSGNLVLVSQAEWQLTCGWPGRHKDNQAGLAQRNGACKTMNIPAALTPSSGFYFNDHR